MLSARSLIRPAPLGRHLNFGFKNSIRYVSELHLNTDSVEPSKPKTAPSPIPSKPTSNSFNDCQEISKFFKDVLPADLKNTNLFDITKKYASLMPKEPTEQQINEAIEVFKRAASLGSIDRIFGTRLMLLCLNSGFIKYALEPWTFMFEYMVKTPKFSNIQKIINSSQYEPPALAALAVYFVIGQSNATVEQAQSLVPRKRLPANFDILKQFGGIENPKEKEVATLGLAKVVCEQTNKFSSPEFLKYLESAPFGEILNRWKQIKLALKPEEIPQVCYATIIRRFADTGQTKRAFDVWQMLVDRSGHIITIDSWAALLRAAAHAPANTEALFATVWTKMIENGYKPNAQCYAENILYLISHGQSKVALLLFKELQSKSDQIAKKEPNADLPIDVQVINLIIKSLSYSKNFSEIDAILKWAQERKIPLNNYTFNPIIEAASYEDINKYFDMMIEHNVKPDIVIYNIAALRLLKKGHSIDGLLEEMKAAGVKPNIEFNSSIAFYIGKIRKDLTFARQLMRTWYANRERINIIALDAFVELELLYGDIDLAVQYSKYSSRFGLTPMVPMHNQIIRKSLRRNRFDVAEKELTLLTSGSHPRLNANKYTFMHILEGWSTHQLQNEKPVRDLVKKAMEKLLQYPDSIDYALAKRINHIFEIGGTDLVPEKLHQIATEVKNS